MAGIWADLKGMRSRYLGPYPYSNGALWWNVFHPCICTKISSPIKQRNEKRPACPRGRNCRTVISMIGSSGMAIMQAAASAHTRLLPLRETFIKNTANLSSPFSFLPQEGTICSWRLKGMSSFAFRYLRLFIAEA